MFVHGESGTAEIPQSGAVETSQSDTDSVVQTEGEIVGHVPYNLAPAVSHFLRRDMKKGFAEVTGGKVNRGAGYGLEVPRLYAYTDRMKELVENLFNQNLASYNWAGRGMSVQGG